MVNSFRLMANRSSNDTVYNSYIGYPKLGITGVYQLPVAQFGSYIGGISTALIMIDRSVSRMRRSAALFPARPWWW